MSQIIEELKNRFDSFSERDFIGILRIIIPVLHEQRKPYEERNFLKFKFKTSMYEEIAIKNYEGNDIFRNGVRMRLADWSLEFSIKESILVSKLEGFKEKLLFQLSKRDFYINSIGSITFLKKGKEFKIAYGSYVFELNPEDCRVIYHALDKNLYFRNSFILIVSRDYVTINHKNTGIIPFKEQNVIDLEILSGVARYV